MSDTALLLRRAQPGGGAAGRTQAPDIARRWHAVSLRIPAGLPYQLVYRKVGAPGPAPPQMAGGTEFLYLRRPPRRISHLKLLTAAFGLGGGLKAAVKLASKRRSLYVAHGSGVVLHHGWVTAGQCRYYRVETHAAVIGPIWTSPEARGTGLATACLRRVMGQLAAGGIDSFYIDTAGSNLPCQRVIEKCGFGPPVALYLRGAAPSGPGLHAS